MKKLAINISFLALMLTCSGRVQSQTALLEDLKELSSDKYEGRKTGTKGNRMAAAYIVKRFREIGLRAFNQGYMHRFSFNAGGAEHQGTNLLAYIQGKKKEAVVISAHYDHLGIVNKQIYNGADDNASGVAALLELASYFKKNQPEHTLFFAAFDAEEMGLKGAYAFVEKPPLSLNLIKLNINLDMISHSDRNELYVAGTRYHPFLKKFLQVKEDKVQLIPGHDEPPLNSHNNWTKQGDHGAFYDKKIPFLYFGVEDHEDYHKPSDDFQNINHDFYKASVAIILKVILNCDKNMNIYQPSGTGK